MTAFDVDFYRRLLDSSPEGVVLVDAQNPDHPVLYVNPGFEALTGYPAADLIGKNLRLLQADDRDQDARHRLREALTRGESCRVLLRNYRKDGRVFWNEMTIVPLVDAAGRVTHFAGHHRDAGERLRIDPKMARDSLSGAHQPTAVAIRDDRLTGLYTLPYLEELLKRDWAVARREGRSIGPEVEPAVLAGETPAAARPRLVLRAEIEFAPQEGPERPGEQGHARLRDPGLEVLALVR